MKTFFFRGLATAIVLALLSAVSAQGQPPFISGQNLSLRAGASDAPRTVSLRQLANRSHPLRPDRNSLKMFRNRGKAPQSAVRPPLKDAASGDEFTLHAFNFVPYDGGFMERYGYCGNLPLNPAGAFVQPESTFAVYGVDAALRVGDYIYVNYKYPAAILGVAEDVRVIDVYVVESYNGQDYFDMAAEVFDNADLGIEADVAEKVRKSWGTSMTLDRSDNKIYTLSPSESGTRLVRVEWSGGFVPTPTDLATLPGEWFSLSCDNSGQLYAMKVERTDDAVSATKLYKIDKTNGTTTLVGDTGQKPWQDAGAVIDPNDNTCYWLVQDNRDSATRLTKVNLSTGAATTVYTYDYDSDEHPVGLFGYVAPNPATPMAPTDLSYAFEGPSLTGTLTFKAPAYTISGEPGDPSVELVYTVSCDGKNSTGKCRYGEEVTATITVTADGNFTASVKVADGSLESNVESVSGYAGRAVPSSVSSELEYDAAAQRFSLTWDEPNTRYVKGYYNPDEITYTVTRYPDEVVVADRIKEREFSESCEGFGEKQFARYYYEVLVYHYDIPANNGRGVASNAIPMGRIQPPYRDSLDEMSRTLLGYTVIDGNGDNNKWRNGSGYISISNPGNSSETNNDWLITPNMYLERGKSYFIDFSAYVGYKSVGTPNNEPLDVYVGTAPTIESLEGGQKVGSFEVVGTRFEPDALRVTYTPDATGIYYLGFCSRANRQNGCSGLYLLPWELSAGVAQGAPDVPLFKSVERQINGDLEATIVITAPSKAIDGTALMSISRIDVMRGGNVVKTFDNPAPGTDMAPFVDVVDKPGDHSWTAVAYNGNGAGKISDVFTAFIGQDIAAAPENFKVTETEWGSIHASWDRVTTDRNGNRIDPSRIIYRLSDYVTGTSYGGDISATEFDGAILGRHDSQQWKQFMLYAFNESGNERNRCAMTEPMVLGAPLAEYRETWERGVSDTYPTYTLWAENEGDADIESAGVAVPGIFAYTGAGMLKLTGKNEGDASYVVTPRVDLSEQEHPAFSFRTYGIMVDNVESLNEIEVYVRPEGAGGFNDGWVLLAKKTVSEIAHPRQWSRYVVDLSQYAGKVVQIKLLGRVKNFINILYDDLAIASIEPVDLGVDKVEAPASAKPGSAFTVDVHLTNYGAAGLDKYSVELDINGTKTTLDGTVALATSDKAVVSFEVTMPGFDDAAALDIRATAIADGDTQLSNNAMSLTVDPELTRLPVPTGFKGLLNSVGLAELSWNAPTAEFYPSVNETFDLGKTFEPSYNDWIFIDRDEMPVGKYYFTFTIPNLTPGETKTSWTVWNGNGTQSNYGDYFLGVSDYYSLVAYYREDYGECDDWAITPELDGSAQTVSFKARGLFMELPPVFDVYYSMGSTDPKDFIAVPGMTDLKPIPAYWTTYYARIPEGARRLAFRSRIKDSETMLQIDDVCYVSASPADVVPAGYTLYRDDAEAFTTQDLSWTDVEATSGTHAYRVSATYSGYGESAPTAPIVLSPESGLLPVAGSNVAVSVSGRDIIVAGAPGKVLNIYDTLGRNIFCGIAAERSQVTVAPGIYLVVVGGRSAKVIVM